MKDSEITSHSYDVTGPDNDGELGVEWDVDTNIIWLSRSDVERMLARFEEHRATIPDAPPKSPLCPKCGSVIGQNQMNDGHWHCRNLSCDWTQPDPAQRPKIPEALEGYRAGCWDYPQFRDGCMYFDMSGNLCNVWNPWNPKDGKRWIAVKDAPAASTMLLDCEGCWTHSIPINECDGDKCPLCESSALVEQEDGFDATVWGGGRNQAYKQPAPDHVSQAGKLVNPIEPLSLLAGTGIVEVIRKMNEIIERLNGKGGAG
jgi:hypothetical protein